MNAAALPTARVPRARSESNLKFNNDGSFESVEQLLHKLSAKCYARVQAMGLPMEFDDVYQEMCVSYTRARVAWKPDGGSLFSTYCTTACMNNFNTAIKKMERDRAELGLVSLEGMLSSESGEESSGDSGSPYEVFMSSTAPENDEPGYRMERAQQTRSNLNNLSEPAKRLVAILLQSEQRGSEPQPKLRELAKIARIEGEELKRVKLEILGKFGVTWH